MSKCDPFVLADDGQFYRDPMLEGDGWCLYFDDEEDPCLVVRRRAGESKDQAEQRIAEILRSTGCMDPVFKMPEIAGGMSIFAKESKRKPRPSWRCYVELQHPIPVSMMRQQSPTQRKPAYGIYYTFGRRHEWISDARDVTPQDAGNLNCGNCLMERVEIVPLVGGKCPRCGAVGDAITEG